MRKDDFYFALLSPLPTTIVEYGDRKKISDSLLDISRNGSSNVERLRWAAGRLWSDRPLTKKVFDELSLEIKMAEERLCK